MSHQQMAIGADLNMQSFMPTLLEGTMSKAKSDRVIHSSEALFVV